MMVRRERTSRLVPARSPRHHRHWFFFFPCLLRRNPPNNSIFATTSINVAAACPSSTALRLPFFPTQAGWRLVRLATCTVPTRPLPLSTRFSRPRRQTTGPSRRHCTTAVPSRIAWSRVAARPLGLVSAISVSRTRKLRRRQPLRNLQCSVTALL